MNAVIAWAQDVAVRAVKTFAQTLAGMLAAGAVDVLHMDWRADLAVAGGAALACVLQNVSSFPTPMPAAPAAVVVSTPAEAIQHTAAWIKAQYGTTLPPVAPLDAGPVVAAPVQPYNLGGDLPAPPAV